MMDEKKKLAYDVIAKLLQEYTSYPLKEGEEILTFRVTAFIGGENDSLRRTVFSMGAFGPAETFFNLKAAIAKGAENEGHTDDDDRS